MTNAPSLDAEFTRKVALGILSTLQLKGLLTSEEVDAILIAARRSAAESVAAQTAPSASPPQSSAPTAAVSRPGVRTIGPSLSDPPSTPAQFFSLPPRQHSEMPPAPEAPQVPAPQVSAPQVPALQVPGPLRTMAPRPEEPHQDAASAPQLTALQVPVIQPPVIQPPIEPPVITVPEQATPQIEPTRVAGPLWPAVPSDPTPSSSLPDVLLDDTKPAHSGAAPLEQTPQPASPAPEAALSTPLVLDSVSEAERLAEARWTRKQPLPPPTFDIEL